MALMLTGVARAADADDNVYVAERVVTCRINAKDGKVTDAKITQDYQLSARRVESSGVLLTFYDRNSKVDDAGASGGKPEYRAWEDGDIFYSGTRVCMLPVKVKPGKNSKAHVQVSYENPAFLDDIMLTSSLYDIESEKVTVQIPAEVADWVTVDIFNGTGREKLSRETDKSGNVTVTVTADNVKAFSGEPMMPDPTACLPIVRINAAFPKLDDLYTYLRPKLESHENVDADIAALAGQLAGEAGTGTQARIDAVARWVRKNIRYVAIEHGELAHKPVPAAEVLRNRYGDCKGSANLICALLKSMGIDGRRVWVGTRGGVVAPFSKSTSLGGADHMIAAAFVGDSVIYVDGTAENAPRGYVSKFIAGQECMIENGDRYLLTHVSDPYPSESLLRQTGRLAVDGNTLRGSLRYEMTGGWRSMIETAVAGTTAARRPQILNSFLTHGRKSIRVEEAELLPAPAYDADSSVIVATVSDSEGVKAVSARSKLYVMPRLLRMNTLEQVDAHNRRWPIDASGFRPIEADVVIDLPDGYVADRLPFTATIDNPWFEGSVTYSAENNNSVRCTASLRQRRQDASAAEAAEWNNAVKEVDKASNSALVLLKANSK